MDVVLGQKLPCYSNKQTWQLNASTRLALSRFRPKWMLSYAKYIA
jgi:hypothetical protein